MAGAFFKAAAALKLPVKYPVVVFLCYHHSGSRLKNSCLPNIWQHYLVTDKCLLNE